MAKEDMPRRGIQDLRDFVIKELRIEDPEFKGYGNLIENVVTILHRNDRIQWKPPPDRQIMALTSEQLRFVADQIDAYEMLTKAGADMSQSPAIVSVHGTKIGYVWWTRSAVMLALDTDAKDMDWMPLSKFHELFPIDDGPEPDSDEFGDR